MQRNSALGESLSETFGELLLGGYSIVCRSLAARIMERSSWSEVPTKKFKKGS